MCGIAGIISSKTINHQHLASMSKVLQHRGPGGRGYMLYSETGKMSIGHNQSLSGVRTEGYTCGFVHRRLSIIDLSDACLQPMINETGAHCLIYNGEIYNYSALRTELQDQGHKFATRGDSEVLLHAYESWGIECLARLNEMWAFALLDALHRRLILSRDRFGIKPLYYTLRNDTLYFASKIKASLAVSKIERKPNDRTLTQYIEYYRRIKRYVWHCRYIEYFDKSAPTT